MNILKLQGHVSNSVSLDTQDSQYILNWIAAGGNQHSNNQVTDVWGDNSYNIPNNIISTNFTNQHNNNISIHDAQYVNNWLKGQDSAQLGGNSKLFSKSTKSVTWAQNWTFLQ